MKSSYIDYKDTGYFSSTVVSYINNDPKLAPFISYPPTLEGFKSLLDFKKNLSDRNVLVSVLRKQYAEITDMPGEAAKPVSTNIDLLSEENTYTITTGHQLNIFTGPLYFIYKIITAINLAKDLKEAFPDKNFVPVYWMATEDHDFAEINHVRINGKKVVWEHQAAGATGRLDTKSVKEAVTAYKNALGVSENSEKIASVIEDAYFKQATLSSATRYLVNELFKDYGLVIIDADSVELKKQFIPYVKRDLTEEISFRAITASSEALEQAGYKTQVNAREINFFYLKDQLRERLVKEENGRYYVLNTELSFTEEELLLEIETHPERFSPNVIMRPLYQEVILPNLAYIGGGAEVVYWLQLKKNFEQFDVSFPVLILRNSAMVVDEGFSPKLRRSGIETGDIFKAADEIKKEWVLKNSEHSLTIADELVEFNGLFEKLKLRSYKIDPTLSPSTEAVKARLNKALQNLEKKLIKAEKRNHESALSLVDHIKAKYFEGGGLQERSDNFGSLYIKHGDDLIKELVTHFKPLDFNFTILEP